MVSIDTNERFICLVNNIGYSFNFNYLLSLELNKIEDGYDLNFLFINKIKIKMYLLYSQIVLVDYNESEFSNLIAKETKEKYMEVLKEKMMEYHLYITNAWMGKKEFSQINDFIVYNSKKISLIIETW